MVHFALDEADTARARGRRVGLCRAWKLFMLLASLLVAQASPWRSRAKKPFEGAFRRFCCRPLGTTS